MKVSFDEINEKHHLVCGVFLFYRLPCGLYKRYQITGMDKDSEYLKVREVR